ncbi:MAG: hypothetical protein ACPGVG_11195, partial [Mycobacterium sp.]
MVIIAMVIIAMVIIAMVIIAMVMVIIAMVVIAMVVIAMVVIAMVVIAMVVIAMVVIAGGTDRAFSHRAFEAGQVHGYRHRPGLTADTCKCSRRNHELVVNQQRRGSCIDAYENPRECSPKSSPPVSIHAPTSDHCHSIV